MLHVLEDHDEWVALHADTVELDNVLVLEVGQQLGLSVEVLASIVAGILQRLGVKGREGRKPAYLKWRVSKRRLCGEGIISVGPELPDGKEIQLIYSMKNWKLAKILSK